MENSKHTKGQWRPQYISGVCMGVGSEIETNYFQIICNTILPEADEEYKKEKEEIEANAKLIAAAPELLENLIRCVDRLEENGFEKMSAVRRAKEAINKATK